MKNKINKSEVVNWEELITSNMIQLEAIVNILDKKNIASKDEIIEEIKKIRSELEQRARDLQKLN